MDVLNRAVVLLIPKQPYLDWANSFDDGGPTIALADVREHATTFLIPVLDTLDQAQEAVRAESEYMFECALVGWMVDEVSWPRDRGYSVLRQWFSIEVYEMPIDLTDDPLNLEDL